MPKLNDLLQALADAPPDRRLDQLEPAVWRRLEKPAPGFGLAGRVRLAAMALGLVTGVTVGGVAAAQSLNAPHEVSVFTADAELAPSTLLEGRS